MRLGTKLWIWLAALTCVAAALTISVQAARAVTPELKELPYPFKIQGTHGYSILALPSADEDDGVLQLIVERRGSEVSYVATATVTPTSIQADLGALGRVLLEFKPSGNQKTTRLSCGGKFSYKGGFWAGTFEFHGEEGYTEADATHALALPRLVLDGCGGGAGFGEENGPGLPGAALTVVSTAHRRELRVEVHKNRPVARVRLEATLFESRGEILIARSVKETAPASALSFDPMLRTASLAPPTPFSGHASFQRTPGTPRWTGNLALDFPGRSNVPLTGPKVHVSLVHARFTQAPPG